MARRRFSAKKPGPLVALVLPGYSDLAEIGGGAFATVYRAVEDATGRPVALKVLKLDTVHEHLLKTFQHEIEALAKVSDHPNIVTLYRPLTSTDGRPVLVLELCRESVADQIRTAGSMDAQDVVRAGIKIAGALETAHRNGFLHRDMKPQNILITQFWEPALADFGVAALQASAQATAGVFGFTTLHAAPEVLEGLSLSPATDVYGLASTMYQLLTGTAPFTAFESEAPASVILRILRDPVRPLRSEGVPLELSDLLETSMAKDPSLRPATAVEFASALQEVESVAGWPPTAYAAWGEIPAAPGSEVPRTGRGRVHQPDDSLPPLLPRSAPTASWSPPTPIPEVPLPAPARPPLAPSGPSVQVPPTGLRHVVTPTESRRGQPTRPMEPAAPLPPLLPPAHVDRPTFADPEPLPLPPLLPRSQDRSVAGVWARPARLQNGAAPAGRRVGDSAALAVAGLAVAVSVVLIAILLIVGII